MIPLPLEEYFDDEICNHCYAVGEVDSHYYLANDEEVFLCRDCGFGIYQCIQCRQLVSYFGENYREMVYVGPEYTWNDLYIFCRECFMDLETEEESMTDTEDENVFICGVHTETQTIF